MYQFPESAPFASPKHNTRPEWKKDDHHRSAKLAMSAKPWITDVPCQWNSNSPIYDPRSRRSHKLANISNRTNRKYWGFLTPLPSKSLDANISSSPTVQLRCFYYFAFLGGHSVQELMYVPEINVLCRQEPSRDQHRYIGMSLPNN